MESSEQIDYSLDSSKDIKPACSYASMITWAILSSPDECLSLHGIYEWIKEHYAFYRLVPSGWQVRVPLVSSRSYINLLRTRSVTIYPSIQTSTRFPAGQMNQVKA